MLMMTISSNEADQSESSKAASPPTMAVVRAGKLEEFVRMFTTVLKSDDSSNTRACAHVAAMVAETRHNATAS